MSAWGDGAIEDYWTVGGGKERFRDLLAVTPIITLSARLARMEVKMQLRQDNEQKG